MTSHPDREALADVVAALKLDQKAHSWPGVHMSETLREKVVAALRNDLSGPCVPDGWCQPMDEGKHSPRKFMIYYDDRDMGVAVYNDEAKARAHWEKATLNWNCYLFAAMPLAPSPREAGETTNRDTERYSKLSNDEATHLPEGCSLPVSMKTTHELINERLRGPSDINERRTARELISQECDWPAEGKFTFLDEPGEHDPCYVVMPGGSSLPVNHHASPGVDIARAKFIVEACNMALTFSDDEDETYEIGKRDGYEDAIQDLDLATGGDGEFKGSTIPGCTVDVPAMKARIIDRLAALPPEPAGLPGREDIARALCCPGGCVRNDAEGDDCVALTGREMSPNRRDQIDAILALLPAPSATDANFRSQVFQAAERANKRFGQWMPQRWLEIFIGEMNEEPE